MKIAYNSAQVQTGTFTSPPQTHLGKAALPPFTAENGFTRCLCNAHCRDESNRSAAGTLHSHRIDEHTTTAYTR